MTTTNWMRGGLAMALTLAFFGALAGLFFIKYPDTNKELITFMLGQLSGFVGTALAVYFGTTQASATKDATINNLSRGGDTNAE